MNLALGLCVILLAGGCVDASGNAASPSTGYASADPDTTMPALSVPPPSVAEGDPSVADAQRALLASGIYAGPIDGQMTQATSDAVLRFQRWKGLPATGSLDLRTQNALGLSAAPPFARQTDSEGASGSTQAQMTEMPPPSVTPMPQARPETVVPAPKPPAPAQPPGKAGISLPDVPIVVGERALVVESVKCEGAAGVWMILLEGEVTNTQPDRTGLVLEKRYGLRYTPSAREGRSDTDWWCVPRRRYCYAPVKFDDWGGAHRAGENVEFQTSELFASKLTLVNVSKKVIAQACP